jgi:hypothetical protein
VGFTFERYRMLDEAEPLVDGHRVWSYLTRRLGFTRKSYGEAVIESGGFDAWSVRGERLRQIDREQIRLPIPPPASR